MPANLSCVPPEAVRLCKLSGVEAAILEKRLASLEESEKFLQQVIRDAKSARDSHSVFRSLEIAARVTLVTCDVAMLYLEEVTGPIGIAVSKGYDGAKLIVEATNGGLDEKKGYELLAKNKAQIAELTAGQLGAGKTQKAIKATTTLLDLSKTLWEQISGARQGAGGGEGIQSGIDSVRNQLEKIRWQIRKLREELGACDGFSVPSLSLG